MRHYEEAFKSKEHLKSYWIFSSSSASSSSVVRSSSSSFSFCLRALVSNNFHLRTKGTGQRTLLTSSCSCSASSRWCRRLNLLILSWSSRRTSTSSLPSSSAFESYTTPSVSVAGLPVFRLYIPYGGLRVPPCWAIAVATSWFESWTKARMRRPQAWTEVSIYGGVPCIYTVAKANTLCFGEGVMLGDC